LDNLSSFINTAGVDYDTLSAGRTDLGYPPVIGQLLQHHGTKLISYGMLRKYSHFSYSQEESMAAMEIFPSRRTMNKDQLMLSG
jgi:hypothetical protein